MAQISPVERTSARSSHARSKRPLLLDPLSDAAGINREISQAFILPDPDAMDVEHGGVDYHGQNNYEQSVATALRRKVDDFLGLKFFPTIKDHKDYLKFRRFQYARFDVYSAFITLLLYLMTFVTRANLPGVPNYAPCFAAAFAVALIALLILTLIMFASIVLYMGHSSLEIDDHYTWLVVWCNALLKSKLRWLAEELMSLLITLSIGLYLIARVQAGPCGSTITIWQSQSCNPVANSSSIPHDFVILGYISPLVFQLALKGIRFYMIVVSWAATTACIIAAIATVQGWYQLWTIVYCVFFLYVMCEVERVMRISYLQHIKYRKGEENWRSVIAREQTALREVDKLRRELKIVTLQAEKDKREMEEERERFRSMVGNVAHDLKTPLQSVGMSIELLRSDLISAMTATPAATAEIQQTINQGMLTTFVGTLDSLMSMSTFMKMSINRCLDFTKANSGITLVPCMESVELKEALQVPIGCINSLQSDTKIIADPIPDEVCPYVITDKHWLMENILCLLSNAIKYSTGGTVNIYMSIEFRTHEFISHKVLRITVEDTGIGIRDEVKAKLFQPFRQGQRLAGGTGLGLYSLSKRLEALGGLYGVHDRKDGRQGSAFWISFPYRPDHMSTNKSEKDSRPGSLTGTTPLTLSKLTNISPTNARRGSSMGNRRNSDPALSSHIVGILTTPIPEVKPKHLKILIVEDSLSILKVVTQMLRQKGHQVETATNGSFGLDRLIMGHAGKDFDVCLCDLQMPVMDGIECTRRYREYEKVHGIRKAASQRYKYDLGILAEDDNNNKKSEPLSGAVSPEQSKSRSRSIVNSGIASPTSPAGDEVVVDRLPIIGMSANNDTLSKDAAIEAGMNLFIGKPFTIKDLETVLDDIPVRERSNKDMET